MKAVHKRRLLRLAEFLRETVSKLPKRRFKMKEFGQDLRGKEVPGRYKAQPNDECHTAACAAGWGTAIFKDLRLERSKNARYASLLHVPTATRHLSACEIFFGTDGDQTNWLFGPLHRRTALTEAAIIEKFVKEQG